MKVIRQSNENEMILEFLKGELNSDRFNNKLSHVIEQLSFSKDLILKANLNNFLENKKRKMIMNKFRGYPDKELFNNFPKIDSWQFVQFNTGDLNKINYINYDYWNELSSNTSSALVAAENIKKGIEIYNVSNKPYIDGLKILRTSKFPPVILITCNNEKFLVIEGHSRITIYGLEPKLFNDSFAFVGICSEEEMKKYDKRMILKH